MPNDQIKTSAEMQNNSANLVNGMQIKTSRLDRATEAVYRCRMPDGDGLSAFLHGSEYVDATIPVESQLEEVRVICRAIAYDALEAADGRS